jgi:hypothetical protein
MLFGTAGDHIEVVIGLLLGFLVVVWALISLVQWLKTTPWKQNGAPANGGQIARGNVDDDQHAADAPRSLPRLVVG